MTLEEYRKKARALERDWIKAILESHEWVMTRAATELGITPSGLRHLCGILGLMTEYEKKGPGRGRPRA